MVSLRGGDEALHSAFAQLDLDPRNGRLVALKTKEEVRAALETFEAHVVELPARYAGVLKDVIQTALPDLKTADFQHLRRVAQWKFLPPRLQKQFKSPRGDDESFCEDDNAELEDTVRYFLVCPTTAISKATLQDILRRNPPFMDRDRDPRIFHVEVPALAPTSPEQAAQWSLKYWPISYKNTNPYGPHPSLVARNTAEIEAHAGKWLSLADSVAQLLHALSLGERVGCVIVDNNGERQEIIAVAGDCRWRSSSGAAEPHQGPGNVMAHAVERAIAMAAKKRLRAAGKDPDLLDRKLFCDWPLTDLEKQFYEQDNILPNGYLCVDLDIYITHEPCVMCSMAILHSRFKRCVFAQRMPMTGGLTADAVATKVDKGIGWTSSLGQGIFWRPSELNWKLLAWEWIEEDAKDSTNDCMNTTGNSDTLHA
ncbi:cytidine deaminase-like protein [Lophiostoma macrostomum CBS 122681]|uniref:Cytidine deaminase-like protein n=1 Tax=Lophiostoma macrostomum CBS 122681 TaxID=1314788 RepID=A0A6A6T1R7_9PLEO|nr:cytidine deaminase-like protein [Lophiostoma macrostomum CBS 122681]